MFQLVCTISVSIIRSSCISTAVCCNSLHSSDTCNAEAGNETVCRGCSALFHAVRGIQKLDLSDTVVRDDAMQAVAQLSNLNNLNLAYSGISVLCKTMPVENSSCVYGAQCLELTSLLHQLCCVTITLSHSAYSSSVAMLEAPTTSPYVLTLYPKTRCPA